MVCIKNYWKSEKRDKKGEICWSLKKKNFPNFTMEMICVTKYAGMMTLRKDARTRFLRKKTIFKSLRNNVRQCLNLRY